MAEALALWRLRVRAVASAHFSSNLPRLVLDDVPGDLDMALPSDRAPYLPALVASSCSAIPTPWAAAGLKRTAGRRAGCAFRSDPEMRELGAHQSAGLHALPLALHEQVVARRETGNAMAEVLGEQLGILFPRSGARRPGPRPAGSWRG